jgi:excinuclease ABC subunit A
MNDLLRPALNLALSSRVDSLSYKETRFSNLSLFDTLLVLDQNPIGHTRRADVCTYSDLLTPLRYLFASLPEASIRGLSTKHFSYNHRRGMCKSCWGLGTRTVQLQFLPSVRITCETCHGFRLNALSLTVTYKGKHLGLILQMSVEEALHFLPPIPKALRILNTLIDVGLPYLQLGQEIATLSGGEAQRLRLVRELAKRTKGHTLYLFDEPTVGLHADDIVKLLRIFQRLIERGHSVILIEHNLDVIAAADYLIDLGPGSGPHGGHLIATGTPEALANHPTSHTGHYLKSHLKVRKK